MFMLRSTHQNEIERLYRMMALQKAAYDMTRRWYQQAAGSDEPIPGDSHGDYTGTRARAKRRLERMVSWPRPAMEHDMTFDEWWTAICEELWRMDGRESADFARAAWNAATKAERERCAELCDALPANDPKGAWFNDDMSAGARECAAAIRAR